MRIRKLTIENFRAVRHAELMLSENANVIAGANGAGKSTVLHAIDIMMSWMVARLRNPKGNGIRLTDSDITKGAEYCKIVLQLTDDTSWTLYKQHSHNRQKLGLASDLKQMTDWVNNAVDKIYNSDGSCPLYCTYGVNRAVERMPKRIRKSQLQGVMDVYKDEKRSNFNSFFVWYKNREDIENEEYRHSSGTAHSDIQLDVVRQAISGVFGNEYGELRLCRRANPQGFFIKKGSDEYRFDALSDGEKAYIGIVADIARKLTMTHPKVSNLCEMEGVVLIDELDLHLHPAWQRDVLPRLLRTFPQCQFIVTTHSPFVVANVKNRMGEMLFTLKEGIVDEGIEHVYGQKSSTLLYSVFDMDNLRPTEVAMKLNVIWGLLNRGDYDSDELNGHINDLKNEIDINDQEFVRIQAQKIINRKKMSDEKNK